MHWCIFWTVSVHMVTFSQSVIHLYRWDEGLRWFFFFLHTSAFPPQLLRLEFSHEYALQKSAVETHFQNLVSKPTHSGCGPAPVWPAEGEASDLLLKTGSILPANQPYICTFLIVSISLPDTRPPALLLYWGLYQDHSGSSGEPLRGFAP